MNNQWELKGDCSKCRRANYCSKNCKARKVHLSSIMMNAFMDIMEEKNPGYKKLMEKIYEK